MENNTHESSAPGGQDEPWVADPTRIHVEPDPSGNGARHLRHDRYPFPTTLTDYNDQARLERDLQNAATEYVTRANELLGLPSNLIPRLSEFVPGKFCVVWLPFADDPRSSFWVTRHEDPLDETSEVIDRTAVLLASLAMEVEKGFVFPLLGGQGLQVLAHCDTTDKGKVAVRMTSVSHTLPHLPARVTASAFQEVTERFGIHLDSGGQIQIGILAEFAKQMAGLFGLAEPSLPIETGFQILPIQTKRGLDAQIIGKTAPQKEAKSDGLGWMPSMSYQIVARVIDGETFEPLSKVPLAAHATAEVLLADPVTQGGASVFDATRPHRDSGAFAPYVSAVTLWNAKAGAKANRVLLEDTTGFIRVLNSPLTHDAGGPANSREVDDPESSPARTHDFAAVNAYVRATEFIRRLLACNLTPATILSYLKFPMDVHYRGGIHPGGGDGNTINAQVRWLPSPVQTGNAAVSGTAEISFALADMRLNPKESPLGIATDARWAWHEWSHVMLVGNTGVLEFAFAHSAGDALAAIVSDPGSELATDPAWRGRTFPWITVPNRMHQRSVLEGWGWTGTNYQPERFFAKSRNLCDKDPYWSEQIQSSSLFRMYRALGGDAMTATFSPGPDPALRQAASDFSVYLILRAIATMGSASVHPVPTPDDFVRLLIAADTATNAFDAGGRLFIGGGAGKVVRWAYQRQGLYPDPAAQYPVDEPGLPPAVDIYIEDQARRTGGYRPLHYYDGDWQASHGSMMVVRAQNQRAHMAKAPAGKKAFLLVFVDNCGSAVSQPVSVRAWVAQISSAGQIPGWKSASWVLLNLVAAPLVKTVPAKGGGQTGPWVFEWTPAASGKRYALLAEASSADDRSNIDPVTGLPCAVVTTGGADASDIAYLVGCDNNLGLLVMRT